MVRTYGRIGFETKKQQHARKCRLEEGSNKKRSKEKENLRSLCGRVDKYQVALVRKYSKIR